MIQEYKNPIANRLSITPFLAVCIMKSLQSAEGRAIICLCYSAFLIKEMHFFAISLWKMPDKIIHTDQRVRWTVKWQQGV